MQVSSQRMTKEGTELRLSWPFQPLTQRQEIKHHGAKANVSSCRQKTDKINFKFDNIYKKNKIRRTFTSVLISPAITFKENWSVLAKKSFALKNEYICLWKLQVCLDCHSTWQMNFWYIIIQLHSQDDVISHIKKQLIIRSTGFDRQPSSFGCLINWLCSPQRNKDKYRHAVY